MHLPDYNKMTNLVDCLPFFFIFPRFFFGFGRHIIWFLVSSAAAKRSAA